ncbi:MAG TPA: hypothetical protein ENI89_12730 [Desulfobulbus sp.]|nr:hypothetical protein [Desulfobulbus sp.]
MAWLKWLPWRFILSRAARSRGFLDPVALLARLHRFAQPSEVGEPIELLRAGAVFHARGLINSRVIQHNLDWVWPYWIERQFDPLDDAFVPRAFSLTHINLTHRNWTAVGWPDCPELPVVDPRGLLTPFLDSWSLDGWVSTVDGRCLLPSRAHYASQEAEPGPVPALVTRSRQEGLSLACRILVELRDGTPVCRMELTGRSDTEGWLVFALRPCNPEGISFIHRVALASGRRAWQVDSRTRIGFSEPVEVHRVSDYRAGDVHIHLADTAEQLAGRCEVGMATAAAMYSLRAGRERTVTAEVVLPVRREASSLPTWRQALSDHCRLDVPETRVRFLYDTAIRTLILHSPGDVWPGPYTYRRFWFRDAAFIIHALLCAGLLSRARRALDLFPGRQTARGYFLSQEGEWDSNGEALWIMDRFCRFTGQPPPADWQRAIVRGGRWIVDKRLPDSPDSPHAGLLPAGFSAEHLGPNDYFYWDDFWGIAGLEAAARLCRHFDSAAGEEFARQAVAFSAAVEKSLARTCGRLRRRAMPASPYRRLDSGAIGSLVRGYPLCQCTPDDPDLLGTAEYLLDECFVDSGFFQDMIHSGINAYLTLHVAQVLLRAGDRRYLRLMDRVAELASPTGQWPEAIHPRTMGGCMGDGQHVWAAAEWIMMVRNCFLREEGTCLVLCSGVPGRWLRPGAQVGFGPAPTSFGPVSLTLSRADGTPGGVDIRWQGRWHAGAPGIEIRLPGRPAVTPRPGENHVHVPLEEQP